MAVAAKIERFNEFQAGFLRWGMNKKSMLLNAPVGVGKSLAVMGLYLLLRQQHGGGKMLVVTARKAAGAFRKANVKKLLMLDLFTEQDMAVLYSGYDFPADVYTISNTLLTKVVQSGTRDQKRALTELLGKVLVLVLDEAHQYRTYNSARSVAMKKVTDYYHKLIRRDPVRHRFVGITATSVFKNLENLHPLFSLLCSPNPLGNWFRFVDRYCVEETQAAYGNRKVYSANGSHSFKDRIQFKRIVGYKNVDELHGIIDPYIFRWSSTDFKFRFSLHYYSLSEPESEEYRASIRGLGLDKTYAIALDAGGELKWAYRNKTDTFFLPDKRPVQTGSLLPGMRLLYDGGEAVVRGVCDRKIDAGYAVRAMKAQQCNSKAEGKLALLVSLIRDGGDLGALVYFNFLDSVDAAYSRLVCEFPGRRIVKLTGQTQRFESVVGSIGERDIVLMSSVASQSLDLYIPRLIVAESFGLVPGKIEQLCGRMTRDNAVYRDVSVDFVLRGGGNVEAYFYEKLRLRLRGLSSNTYVKSGSLPVSEAVAQIPDHLIDEKFLKERLLWAMG